MLGPPRGRGWPRPTYDWDPLDASFLPKHCPMCNAAPLVMAYALSAESGGAYPCKVSWHLALRRAPNTNHQWVLIGTCDQRPQNRKPRRRVEAV